MHFANDFSKPYLKNPEETLNWLTSKNSTILWNAILEQIALLIQKNQKATIFVDSDPAPLATLFEETITLLSSDKESNLRQVAWYKGTALRLADYYLYVAENHYSSHQNEVAKDFYNKASMFIMKLLEIDYDDLSTHSLHEVLVTRYQQFSGHENSLQECALELMSEENLTR